MGATITIIDPEEFAALKKEVNELRSLLGAYVTSNEEWLPTTQALRVAGIKNRETLVKSKRASAPGKQEPGRITYRKDGTKCLYLKSSCIDYVQRKHGQPALAA